MSASAECTWGDGPDVLVLVNPKNMSGFDLSRHRDGHHSFGLLAGEARRLAAELIAAAERAEELDRSFAEHAERGQ